MQICDPPPHFKTNEWMNEWMNEDEWMGGRVFAKNGDFVQFWPKKTLLQLQNFEKPLQTAYFTAINRICTTLCQNMEV